MTITYQDKWDRLLEMGGSIRKKNGSWHVLCDVRGKPKWRDLTDELYAALLGSVA